MAAKEEKWPECSPPVHHTSPRLLPSGWKACLHRGCWVCQLAHLHQHTQTLSLSILISLKIPSCNRINKTKVIPLSGFCLNTGPGCWNQDSGRPKHERHKGSSHHHSKLKSIILKSHSFIINIITLWKPIHEKIYGAFYSLQTTTTGHKIMVTLYFVLIFTHFQAFNNFICFGLWYIRRNGHQQIVIPIVPV